MKRAVWVILFAVALLVTGLGNVTWLKRSVGEDIIFGQVTTTDRYDFSRPVSNLRDHVGMDCDAQWPCNFGPIDTANEDVRQKCGIRCRKVNAIQLLPGDPLNEIHSTGRVIGEYDPSIRPRLTRSTIVNFGPEQHKFGRNIAFDSLTRQDDFGFHPYIIGRFDADIFEHRYNADLYGVSDDAYSLREFRGQLYPGALLISHNPSSLCCLLSGLHCGVGPYSSSFKRVANVNDANNSYSEAKPRENHHPKRPQSHILLGAQILIGGLVGLIGTHLMCYAFGKSRPTDTDTCAGYAVLGFALIFIGAFLIFGMQFTAFGPGFQY